MDFGTIFTVMLFCYLSVYLLNLLISKDMRKGVKMRNDELEKLRNKKDLTFEEQKLFLDMKNPKFAGWHFTWGWLLSLFFSFLQYGFFFYGWVTIFLYFKIVVNAWVSIILWIFFPFAINLLLKKYSLNTQEDVGTFFRRK